jgi:hypothetical protein
MATTDRTAFEAVFPSLVEDLLNHAKKYNLPDNALQWFEKVPLLPLLRSYGKQLGHY